jgi:hypothetical protein
MARTKLTKPKNQLEAHGNALLVCLRAQQAPKKKAQQQTD